MTFEENVSLRPYVTLRAGGAAERFARVADADELAEGAAWAQTMGVPTTVLGWGSNVLPSDAGVPGLTLANLTRAIRWDEGEEVVADSGVAFQDLFLAAAQRGREGLGFAVGIPGSLGGALVSNAGAYRSNVSALVSGVEVVEGGRRRWEGPEWMGFAYRDSRLRKVPTPQAVVVRVRLRLPHGDAREIFDGARENQRQRISKQPPPASAGSFFKNVTDKELAAQIPGLTDGMRAAGVVPAGFLIEACGLKGARVGGAMLGHRHANYMLNVGGATASEIRRLARIAAGIVEGRFGVRLEEEVLYLGDWTAFEL